MLFLGFCCCLGFGGEGLRGGCGVEGLALDPKPNFEPW